MQWTPKPETPLSVRLAAVRDCLLPTERKVTAALEQEPRRVIDMTAQQLADHVGVSRASVIRAAQTLGYEGFPQVRVALAQEIALQPAPPAPGEAAAPALAGLRARARDFAASLEQCFDALTEECLQEAVGLLARAERVLVVANGLSLPLGVDMHLRLTSAGRPAEFHSDAMAQRIAARGLGERCVLFVYSGSGANTITLATAQQARRAGASIVVVTAFPRSPLTKLADVIVPVPQPGQSFREELLVTSRASFMLLTEHLVALLAQGQNPRARALSALSDALEE